MLRASSPGIISTRCLGRVLVEADLLVHRRSSSITLQVHRQNTTQQKQPQSIRISDLDQQATIWEEPIVANAQGCFTLPGEILQDQVVVQEKGIVHEIPSIQPLSTQPQPQPGFLLRRVWKRAQQAEKLGTACKTSNEGGLDGKSNAFVDVRGVVWPRLQTTIDPRPFQTKNLSQKKALQQSQTTAKTPSVMNAKLFSHLQVLRTSQNADEAWHAYCALVSSHSPPDAETGHDESKVSISLHTLNRLARLLASSRPRRRRNYLRLLAVLSRIRRDGGLIMTWQWNALIDISAKGFRKVRLDDYNAAVAVYHDMLSCSVTEDANPNDDDPISVDTPFKKGEGQPDIVTYTTLLDIAARTGDISAVRHALSILHASKLPSNRITHLALLPMSSRYGNLGGVHNVFTRLDIHGQDIGLDGVNAFLWAYAQRGRFDVVFDLYRLLYRRSRGIEGEATSTPIDTLEPLHLSPEDTIAGLKIPDSIKPDHITFTIVIQALAYQGHLINALKVWTHMLTTPRSDLRLEKTTKLIDGSPLYEPSLPIFRALFCGFARHGKRSGQVSRYTSLVSNNSSSPWDLSNLQLLIDAFINLPAGVKPNERTIYWVITAYERVSDGDLEGMSSLWARLKERFGGSERWGGRLRRLDQKLSKESNITNV